MTKKFSTLDCNLFVDGDHMTRCDYDTIFQRVFCVTLVVIAFTFTVILTNVFVDIDGLLTTTKKAEDNTYDDKPEPVLERENDHVKIVRMPNIIGPEVYYKELRNYDEDKEADYRSKRSLESQSFLEHVQNPKMKRILSNRLATLLEELDEEESTNIKKNEEDSRKSFDAQKDLEVHEIPGDVNIKEKAKQFDKISPLASYNQVEKSKRGNKNEDEILHLAMHNILLQGIIGHMDLNDVYKKVHQLVQNFDKVDGETIPKDIYKLSDLKKPRRHMTKTIEGSSPEENKFFDEVVKCDKLQNDIADSKRNTAEKKDLRRNLQKEPQVSINTIIDIISNKKAQNGATVDSKENIKGIVKLIYNGKAIEFTRMADDNSEAYKKNKEIRRQMKNPKHIIASTDAAAKENDTENNDPLDTIFQKPDESQKKSSFFSKIVEDYFNRYPNQAVDLLDTPDVDEVKRPKREIKIKYEDNGISTSSKQDDKERDDNLYVEIETHFDSKGLKGERKKKIIHNIIDKISKAIHSDLGTTNNDNKKKKIKHIQIKKRIQNPLLNAKTILLNKMMIPLDAIAEKHSDPISKSVPLNNPMPKVYDKSGESWKKTYFGPGFLTASKSLNSAETGDVDVDYSKVMAVNGVPQRLQKPLNTNEGDEMIHGNTYFELGNLKFFVKNIEGTGLSIGFNQYTDEPPDPDTIKLFTGIEGLVKKYNQNHVETGNKGSTEQIKTSSEEQFHELSKREVFTKNTNKHVMARSEKDTLVKDYHSNNYEILSNNDYLHPQEIYDEKKLNKDFNLNKETENIKSHNAKNMLRIENDIKIEELIDDNNIFDKKLKPSQILSLANLLDRKKRSLKVKMISNIRSKSKLNRFLDTRGVSKQKIIHYKKRSKRQIGKIRIIARDATPKQRHSEENIFYVDDENVYADRAVIKEVVTPEVGDIEDKLPGEHYDMIPYHEEPHYATNIFNGRSRHNQLMFKYPHMFLDEVARSKEDTIDPAMIYNYENQPNINARIYTDNNKNPVANGNITTTIITQDQIPRIEELVNAINPKQNYKLTVKIMPKNMSDLNAGFKEIHTSINKSFNRGGIFYSSLVNVTEISKIEMLQKSMNGSTTIPPTTTTEPFGSNHIIEQQNKMDVLLNQHQKRIDEQLDHLKRERLRLDTMLSNNFDQFNNIGQDIKTDHIKLAETTETPLPQPLLHMSKEDVSKLLVSLFNMQSLKNTTVAPVTTASPKTTTTTPKTTMANSEPDKLKILNKIEQNENVTNEILHQINKNTEMLQTFLEKLTDSLIKEKELQMRHNEEFRPTKLDPTMNSWKPFHPIPETVYQPQIQYDAAKNETHLSIPFVYAYQQPMTLNNYKENTPMASVVYHGHIHANSLGKHQRQRDIASESQDDVNDKKRNHTRYFIDALENDFKVLAAKKLNNVLGAQNKTTSVT